MAFFRKAKRSASGRTLTRKRLLGEELEPREMLAFDPSPFEQAYLESINRFRADPQAELDVLFSTYNNTTLVARDDPSDAAIDFFNVDASLLLEQWSVLESAPPLAWNGDLAEAALGHTNLMIAFDEQAHDLPNEPDLGQRIQAQGYDLRRATENIYAFAENHLHGHGGFIIDWGEGPGGIQDPAGHRDNYLDPGVEEVGISVRQENNPSTDVGPFVVTQNFGRRADYQPQVLGVVYEDGNLNGIYDPNEGLGNVTISVRGENGTFTTQTLSAGGYQLEVPDGTYEVLATGGRLTGTFVVGNVVVQGENAKADFETRSAAQAPLARPDSITLNEGTTATFLVTPNDEARSGAIVSNSVNIVSEPNGGAVTVDASGRIIYIPNDNFSGNDSFTYTVRDTNGATSNVAAVSLTVANSPDAPTVAPSFPGTAFASEDGQAIINLESAVVDPDGDLDWNTIELVQTPSQGQAEIRVAQRQIIYTPRAGFSGSDSLSFRVSDATNRTTAPISVAITVSPVNDRPTATDDTFTLVDRTVGFLSVLENDRDPDGDIANANLEILTAPRNGTAVINGQNIQYVAASGFVGSDSIRYRVQDEQGAFSDPVTVTTFVVSTAGNPWQNPGNRFDVTGEGDISPLDALVIINNLGQTLVSPQPGVITGASPFYDVDGNGVIAPLDALQVVNRLNETVAASQAASSSSFDFNAYTAAVDEIYAAEEDDEEE